MLALRLLRRGGARAASATASPQLRALSTATSTGAPERRKKVHNDPSLRVRVVPMFTDNYGALVRFEVLIL